MEKEVHNQTIYITIHCVAFAFVLVFFSFFKPSKFPLSKLQYACWNLFTSLGCTWKGRPNNNLTQKKSGVTKYLHTLNIKNNAKNMSFLHVFVPSINEFCSISKISLLIKTKSTCLFGKSKPLSPHPHNLFPLRTISVGVLQGYEQNRHD